VHLHVLVLVLVQELSLLYSHIIPCFYTLLRAAASRMYYLLVYCLTPAAVPLLCCSDNVPRLQEFTARFTARFCELMHDVSEEVAAAGLRLLAVLVQQNVVTHKVCVGWLCAWFACTNGAQLLGWGLLVVRVVLVGSADGLLAPRKAVCLHHQLCVESEAALKFELVGRNAVSHNAVTQARAAMQDASGVFMLLWCARILLLASL
jgi:hypothetical protein